MVGAPRVPTNTQLQAGPSSSKQLFYNSPPSSRLSLIVLPLRYCTNMATNSDHNVKNWFGKCCDTTFIRRHIPHRHRRRRLRRHGRHRLLHRLRVILGVLPLGPRGEPHTHRRGRARGHGGRRDRQRELHARGRRRRPPGAQPHLRRVVPQPQARAAGTARRGRRSRARAPCCTACPSPSRGPGTGG